MRTTREADSLPDVRWVPADTELTGLSGPEMAGTGITLAVGLEAPASTKSKPKGAVQRLPACQNVGQKCPIAGAVFQNQ